MGVDIRTCLIYRTSGGRSRSWLALPAVNSSVRECPAISRSSDHSMDFSIGSRALLRSKRSPSRFAFGAARPELVVGRGCNPADCWLRSWSQRAAGFGPDRREYVGCGEEHAGERGGEGMDRAWQRVRYCLPVASHPGNAQTSRGAFMSRATVVTAEPEVHQQPLGGVRKLASCSGFATAAI